MCVYDDVDDDDDAKHGIGSRAVAHTAYVLYITSTYNSFGTRYG